MTSSTSAASATAAGLALPYESLAIDAMDTPEAQLEFQNFVLNSAEQNLISGSVNSSSSSRQKTTAPNYALPPQTAPENISGSRPSGGAFWTIEYYSKYFDVDTSDVLERMLESILPRGQFMDKIGTNPDLYGPFWIATTVIFALFATSSIAGSISAYTDKRDYNYDMTLLSIAVSTVYSYQTALPGVLWGMARYFGCPIGFLELIDLYGYSMAVWIPVSLLCIIPSEALRWVLIGAAFASSTFFIVQNILPLLSLSSNPTAKTAFLAVIAVCHAGLALLFRFEFFRFVHSVSGGGGSGVGGEITSTSLTSSLSGVGTLTSSAAMAAFTVA